MRNSRETWIKEGLKVLAQLGNAGLTIDELTKRLKVTKGSFYHHFKHRQEFSEALLSYWEDQMTLEIIHASREANSFEERNRKLFDLSNKLRSYKLEVAIRAWALRDPIAKTYQQRVDQHRIKYLKELYSLYTSDSAAADKMAAIRYAFVVGAQQLIPSIQGKELEDLFATLHRSFDAIQ